MSRRNTTEGTTSERPASQPQTSPTMTSLPVAAPGDAARYAAAILRPHQASLAAIMVIQVIAASCAALVPWQIGRLVDHLTTADPSPEIGLQTAAVIVCAAMACAALTGWGIAWSVVLAERTVAQLRMEFMNHVLRVPLSMIERVGTGAVVSRATRDMETLSRCIRDALPRVLTVSITLLVLISAMLLTSGWAGLALLVVGPLLLWTCRWYLARSRRGFIREGHTYDKLYGHGTETLHSVRTIDSLNLSAARAKVTRDALQRAWCAERYTLAILQRLMAAGEFVPLAAVSLTVTASVPLVVHGVVSAGQTATASLYLLGMSVPINGLLRWIHQIQLAATSLARLVGIGAIVDDRTASTALPTSNTVTLDSVSFRYTPERPVLQDISLTIPAGQRVTIVGPSGSGKSTLGRLIGGVNPPRTGAASLGGVPIVALPANQLHQRVCLLTQEHHVFNATVADNLRLATPDATDADLWDALRVVGAHDAVAALPDGLHTMIGSGHVGLDPAVAQQLALARVIVADPDVIIMDEATSLLDPRAARTMEQALHKVLAGRTVIAIAHRLHTAHDADRILVMEDGRIVEDGSHSELLAANGNYAALWHTWQATDA